MMKSPLSSIAEVGGRTLDTAESIAVGRAGSINRLQGNKIMRADDRHLIGAKRGEGCVVPTAGPVVHQPTSQAISASQIEGDTAVTVISRDPGLVPNPITSEGIGTIAREDGRASGHLEAVKRGWASTEGIDSCIGEGSRCPGVRIRSQQNGRAKRRSGG